MTGIVDIDHLMIGIGDPDEAAAALDRLGFFATPLSSMPELGLANRCVLLTPARAGAANYLELLGHDPTRAAPFMRALLAGGEGIKSLVLAADDIERARATLALSGAPASPARRIERSWSLPGETLDLAFSVATPELGAPPVYCNLCQHHTPHHYLRAEWRRHANGARALVAVLLESPDPDSTRAWFAALFGDPPGVAIEVRHGPLARARGFAVSVDDVGATARLLAANGVAIEAGPELAARALGCRIEFRQASDHR